MNKLIITKDASKIYIEQQINVSNLVFYKNTFSLNCKFILLENKNNINTFKVVAQGEAFGFHTNNFLLSEIELNGLPTFTTSDDLFTYFNANFGEVVAGVTFDGQLTQGGNTVSSTNRLPVDIGGGTVVIEGDVVVQNEVEIKNEDGNPIPTTNIELQTYLSENLGKKTDEKATNKYDEVSLFSFIKGIFDILKGIFDKTPKLQDGNVPVFVNNPLREITVYETEVFDGNIINISSVDRVTSFSIIANQPNASIENVNLGVIQPVNAISQDYHGAILTSNLNYKIIGSDGILIINKLV